jgi:hypothetical protein
MHLVRQFGRSNQLAAEHQVAGKNEMPVLQLTRGAGPIALFRPAFGQIKLEQQWRVGL